MAKQRRKVVLDLFGLESDDPPDPVRFRNRSAMASEWRDPADSAPSARKTARQVRGHRHFDPIRQHVQRHGERSCFTVEMIEAADMLRADYDGGRIGFSSGRDDGLPVQSVSYRPSMGPGASAARQMHADVQFRAAWGLLATEADRALVSLVVLENRSLTYAARALGMKRDGLGAHLAGLLAVLQAHYDALELGRRRAA